LWCSTSILLLACNTPKETKTDKEVILENPSPVTEPQTDSLKNYLDKERQRRKP
jgi:hypothetical protein